MPLEKYVGPKLSVLLARATAEIGADAVVLSVREGTDAAGRPQFELLAADADAAAAWQRAPGGLSRFPAERISFCPARGKSGKLTIALVGPTGAGKTTAIAKLATHPQIFGPRAVGFICLDTFRIGGIEQLKIHAALARIPVETVYEPRDLGHALRKLRKCDVILVDTPGRGPALAQDTDATRSILELIRPDEVHLAVPAGLRDAVARGIVEAHRPFGITHLLATKVDEWPHERAVFNLSEELSLPMRWISEGQVVPGGVRSPDPADAATDAAGSVPPSTVGTAR